MRLFYLDIRENEMYSYCAALEAAVYAAAVRNKFNHSSIKIFHRLDIYKIHQLVVKSQRVILYARWTALKISTRDSKTTYSNTPHP